MPFAIQPSAKLCFTCGKEGEAGGPGLGWASVKECMPCKVQRTRVEKHITSDYVAKPRKHGNKVQCKLCGRDETAVDEQGLAIKFKFRTRCWDCAKLVRKQSEAERERARERAKEYYWRVVKGTTPVHSELVHPT